jgi:hypothetical protein
MTYGEIVAKIQAYIHHVKNVEIEINLPRNRGEIRKMQQMYKVADDYFKS